MLAAMLLCVCGCNAGNQPAGSNSEVAIDTDSDKIEIPVGLENIKDMNGDEIAEACGEQFYNPEQDYYLIDIDNMTYVIYQPWLDGKYYINLNINMDCNVEDLNEENIQSFFESQKDIYEFTMNCNDGFIRGTNDGDFIIRYQRYIDGQVIDEGAIDLGGYPKTIRYPGSKGYIILEENGNRAYYDENGDMERKIEYYNGQARYTYCRYEDGEKFWTYYPSGNIKTIKGVYQNSLDDFYIECYDSPKSLMGNSVTITYLSYYSPMLGKHIELSGDVLWQMADTYSNFDLPSLYTPTY